MKKIILAVMLLALICIADAREPKVGDHVIIMVTNSLAPLSINGNITSIGNGLIGINASTVKAGDTLLDERDEVFVGTGQIALMRFVN